MPPGLCIDVKAYEHAAGWRPGRLDHVYLSDFGLSSGRRFLAWADRIGTVRGDPGYTAPEQMQGTRTDGRADQYSLGCAAFELLSGAPPFPRDQVTAVIWAHMSEPPPPLTSRRPDLPAAVDSVLARALAKAQTVTPSCREFADAPCPALGLEPYNSSSGTDPDKETADPPAQHKGRHARASTLSPQAPRAR